MKTAAERFWAKVVRGNPSQCWEWMAGKNKQGYGIFVVRPRAAMTAPRFSLQLATGQTGIGLYACHNCDNPACVNPGHLFWGTQADNMLDARTKGRTRGAPRQTHCKRGHKLDAVNRNAFGQCKICNSERMLRRYHSDVVKSRATQNEQKRKRKVLIEGLRP
jgi:putative hemolysin